MSNNIAQVIHELVSEPELWRSANGNIHITNGYYSIAVDGHAFGMGVALYTAEGEEKDKLAKAVSDWKEKTAFIEQSILEEKTIERPVYDENLYQKFAKEVRAAHLAYGVHAKADVFEMKVKEAIMELDEALSVLNKHKKRTK